MQTLRENHDDAVGHDGYDYSSEYLEEFQHRPPGPHHPFVSQVLGKFHKWDALGFFYWLYDLFPATCLESRQDGGQLSGWFTGNMPGRKFLEHVQEINLPMEEALRHLQVLEHYGILSVVRKGDEILLLELRSSPTD
ncbi:hypothetical protein [Pelagibius marinus]|uniref:hypothetical protein n=1 Tax=Pelagibius marinus TaxID=2762760 RepID=UPI0018730082|nr:hypothetical protein [Pelagibius marinus]